MIRRMCISFFRWKSRSNPKGEAPIYCRLTQDKIRRQFSTGHYVLAKEWDSEKQRAKTKLKQRRIDLINEDLDMIYNKLYNLESKLIVEGASNIVETVYNVYVDKDSSIHFFIQLFQKRYEVASKMEGIKFAKYTLWKFRHIMEQTQEYIKWKYKQEDIPLLKIDSSFVLGFEEYLLLEKGLAPITVNKVLQRVKQIIQYGIKCDYMKVDPFVEYKPLKTEKELVFLTEEELDLLENYQFAQDRLARVRDLYLFSVYTGLAYHEAFSLQKRHIIKGFDKELWISMKRGKTGKDFEVPLLPKAIEIIKKYGELDSDDSYVLPRVSNQKMNSYLKEIAEIIGINKKLTHHTARKTFATTILLYNDIPIEIVSSLLGHSSIAITQKHYARVVNKKVSMCMGELKNKLMQKSY